jgi:hypothetical protein
MFSWDDHHLSSITKFERNKITTQVATATAKCQVHMCRVRQKISSEFSIARSEGKKNKIYQNFIFEF